MKDNSMMHDAFPTQPMIRWIRDVQQAQESKPDLICERGMSALKELLVKDRAESGCVRYAVFHECGGRYLAWRDED